MHLPSINVLVQVVVIGLLTGGVYALMAAGLTLIFGVMKVINIAHGAFLILSAYIAYWLFTSYGVDPVLSVIVSVPLFLLIGAFMQNRMLKRIHSEPGLTVLLTFALALFLQGGMGAIFGTTGRSIRTPYTSIVFPVDFFGITIRLPLVRLVGFILAIVALTVLTLLLLYTDQGRGIRATMQNRSAALLVGVGVDRIQALTFGVGLATVAAGGALFSVIWTFNAFSGDEWISKMLSIIVLGGMGSLPGAFIAALIMGVIEAVASVTMSSYISPIVFYLVLFLTLIFRPQGLLGTRIREG
jgi:branched-chain amino acid transport system permease protein